MAAFLSEMKTVRLRKTGTTLTATEGSSSRRGGSAGSTDSNNMVVVGGRMSTGNAAILKKLGESISRSQSTTSNKTLADTSWIGSRNSTWNRERPAVFDAAKTGEKRKRVAQTREDNMQDDHPHASKRRSSSTSSSLQDLSSASLSESYPPSRQITVPRTSTITPSLCSDKGLDDSDERLPSTPPAAAHPDPLMPVRKLFVPPPRTERETIDVDVDMDGHNNSAIAVTPPPPTRAPGGSRRPPSDVFDKRPPSSPMPTEPSPRKPRPPARIPRAPPPRPHPPDDEEEDELSMSFGAYAARELSPGDRPPPSKGKAKAGSLAANGKPPKSRERAPPPRSQSPLQLVPPSRREKERERASTAPSTASTSSRGAATGRTAKNRRRQTLDEELRSAAAELSRTRSRSSQRDWDREESDNELDADLENGMFVGVGTRPKNRGFLAHGGAGGEPIFMGVGYVEGVEDEPDGDQDPDYEPPPTGRRRANR
ncbi:hypothetical protein C8R45DRAFT_1045491 [Mycena sanguinolenta]|nr:hypothetical protein C8R45DRAFT_1045491 [Mycena sanguinolenta]